MEIKKNTSAIAAIVLFDVMADYGISVSRIENATGINHSLMNDPDARITMPQFLSLWQMAVDVTHDSAIGLHLRKHYGPNLMHFVIIIALNCDTLLGAVQSWARYDQLICETDQIRIFEKEDHYIFTYTNTAPEFENRWIPEQYFSLSLEYGRRISAKEITPLEVWFRHDDPGYIKEYEKIFHCPVLFGKKANLVRFKKKDMRLPIVSPDPYLKAVLVKHADKSIKKIGNPFSLKSRVADYIIKNLHTGQVTIQTVSDVQNMDRSTLYRHLAKEGTSFKQLLVDIRKELARDHLIKGLTATQTAYLLGFTEPSAFQRAFKRWFDQSPGEFRKQFLVGRDL
ncbi:MAG: AraC family transcriptional regulator [Desulfobacula sp.]|nr:AraC family transcriptional regulator [Desulfobacula sp.]